MVSERVEKIRNLLTALELSVITIQEFETKLKATNTKEQNK